MTKSSGVLPALQVDEKTEVSEAITRLVRQLGHQSQVVHEASEAVQELADKNLDVVLADFNLPGTDRPKLSVKPIA